MCLWNIAADVKQGNIVQEDVKKRIGQEVSIGIIVIIRMCKNELLKCKISKSHFLVYNLIKHITLILLPKKYCSSKKKINYSCET